MSVSAHIVFQSHLVTCNRNDYEYVWYYKRLQYTRISDDMLGIHTDFHYHGNISKNLYIADSELPEEKIVRNEIVYT